MYFWRFFPLPAHRLVVLWHEKGHICLPDKCGLFERSVPYGTISTPSVREAMLRIVKCLLIVGGTLHFALCEAQHFTAASPLLHLGAAQISLNVADLDNLRKELEDSKCGADERRRRGLDRTEPLSAHCADADESLPACHAKGYLLWDNPLHFFGFSL